MDLRSCIARFLQTKHLTDVTFTFTGHVKVLEAHRLILSMRSEVFEAMLFGPMSTTDDAVVIEDIDPSIFEMLLSYIYTDDVEITVDDVMPCLYAARKYMLDGLVRLCADFLSQHITEENVCLIHQQACLYQLDQLSARCFAYIIKKAKQLFDRDSLLDLPVESIHNILTDEQLFTDELSNFQLLMKWSQHHCTSQELTPTGPKRREVLGEALFDVRFPLMTAEEFANFVAPTDVLTKDEQLQMYFFLITKKTVSDGSVAGFISVPRLSSPLMLDFSGVKTKATAENADGYNISITCSHDMKIVSLEYEEEPHSCDLDCTIEAVDNDDTTHVTTIKHYCVHIDKKMVVAADFVFFAGRRYWIHLQYPKELRELSLRNTSANSKIIKMTHHFGSMNVVTEEIFEGLSSITLMRV